MPEPDTRRTRRVLRAEMRARRRAVDPLERALADRALVRNVLSWPPYRRARHIAVYLAFDGEPNLSRLIAAAHRQGKKLYVPTLRGATMTFMRLPPDPAFGTNFFGILEPAAREPVDARRLDLVLTPLVACDERGTRIGVGRGYYDRCFEFLRERRTWIRPKLAGVAYELQCVPTLDRQPWDIPLWGLITEKRARIFAQGRPQT